MAGRLRASKRGDDGTKFSWWLLILPAVGISVTAVIAYVYFVMIAEERRVLDHGTDAVAQVVRVWSEDSRDSKGRHRTNRYVHLAWKDTSGAPREFERLRIGNDAHKVIRDNQSAGEMRTAIRYDDAEPGSIPFLLADREYREYDWQFGWWGLVGFSLFTLWTFWLVWNSWRKHRTAG